MIKIYTDGACKGNPGKGGWGALIQLGGESIEIFGGELNTTNNRMELIAVIEALDKVRAEPSRVMVFTDSTYVQKGISEWILNWKKNGWRSSNKQPVKNQDLWMRLDELKQGMTIEWNWVKGHAGHPENERADFLANQGVESI
ncbi:MAG: ribonuclease HI [Methylophilaceae bacterium]|nr:ribonuclease HI [Methylophilaceae bacterium]